ncbi:uncharacterized protein LOC34622554 [Cyclospora cayetanensis]|uniref:Uncharacterized protein LOC34622554 n=1 Tax=Cyclospora cayetanensis TaxID=88456 RepID=A0A6P6RZ19_9EIME|nr:uncharacterized protein LOC34622554 [Cyclospora cayetanensis]
MSDRGDPRRWEPRGGRFREERAGGVRREERRDERWQGEVGRGRCPWEHHPNGFGRGEGRGFGRGRGRGFRGGARQPPLPEYLDRALESTAQRKGQVLCNAWSMKLEDGLSAWGYPISIRESGTERPVEERKERRRVLAELLKALTGVHEPPGSARPRRVVSRGAQHSELLRWLIVYSSRIRALIKEEPTREVALRDGEAPSRVYKVTFGEERPLTGGDWRFYFMAAIMSTLEAASYQRAFGQSQYLKLDPRSLRTESQLLGIDATLVQSEKSWLLKMSRHDRKLELGCLEDHLRDMDHQKAQITYRNRLCVAVHKGNIYRIINVTDTTADRATFEKGGQTINVAQYFKDAYNEHVEGKLVVQAKEVRGGSRVCFLPVNLLRVIAQAPPPTAGSRAVLRPKSAQETLVDCAELVADILRTPAVRNQMSELKLQIGDKGLPLDVQQNVTNLRKLMGDVRSFGEARISWGATERERQQDTSADLSPDFRARLCQNLVLRHKVPLDKQWMLLVCTGRREHGGSRAAEAIKNTIELTRQRIRYKNQLVVEMEAPVCCEHFVKTEAEWKRGKVEVTKRSLRDLFSLHRQGLRGAIVLLAYDSDEVNNRVRIAAKQVSVQMDFPVQCCKLQTLQNFKNKPEDKSMNMWWNVYLQFQTKITDEESRAGVPWAADQPLAPLREAPAPPTKVSEIARAIGIAVNSFGPASSRCAVVGIVGGRNVEHTRFISHIGASDPPNYRAGVVRDMARHFQLFWEKFTRHLDVAAGHSRPAPAHLLIYRSAPSGNSQIKEVLAHEVAAIRDVIEADLGKIEFSSEKRELTIEHPVAAAFPEGVFQCALRMCRETDLEAFSGKAEDIGAHINYKGAILSCDGPTLTSQGRNILRVRMEEGFVPLYRPLGLLICTFFWPESEPHQVIQAEDKLGVVLPDTHRLLSYARSNYRWLQPIKLTFTATADEPTPHANGVIIALDGYVSPEVKFHKNEPRLGSTVYLRKAIISHIIQRVHLNVLVNPHRPASPMRFFMRGRDGVQGLPVGSYIDSGPIIPISPDTATLEKKFLIGTADPTRGSPSASEFHIIANESDWSRHFLAVVSYKLCHMYYNWAGTVKHPHILQMALAIVRQHQIYIASESGYGLDSEFNLDEPAEEQPLEQQESPEEGEEAETRERLQKRRQEGGYATHVGGREGLERTDDAAEREAGKQNLRELKANLERPDSVLMTTAFML